MPGRHSYDTETTDYLNDFTVYRTLVNADTDPAEVTKAIELRLTLTGDHNTLHFITEASEAINGSNYDWELWARFNGSYDGWILITAGSDEDLGDLVRVNDLRGGLYKLLIKGYTYASTVGEVAVHASTNYYNSDAARNSIGPDGTYYVDLS